MAVQDSKQHSIKHALIGKDNTVMFASIAGAVFIVVFCLFVAKSLLDQSSYNSKVISKKREALNTLKDNRKEAEKLRDSYVSFATEPINIIGGSPAGTGPKDGDNAKLVLDSLPYELDFPALSSSIEKILLDGGYTIQAIGGDDKGSTGNSKLSVSSGGPIEVEFPLGINTSIEGAMNLLQTLELSIRPFQITTLSLDGNGNNLDVSINMKTFYKPQTTFQIGTETIKR